MHRKLAAHWNFGALAATIKKKEGTHVRWNFRRIHCFCGCEATTADLKGSLAAVGSKDANVWKLNKL